MPTTLLERLGLPLRLTQIIISIGLVTPIFFQLNGAIFADKMTNYDGNGDLFSTPLPFSIIACLVGILLFTNIRQAKVPILFVLLSFTLMLVSFIVSALWADQPLAISKFILLAQFTAPMLGLILGFSWQDSKATQQEAPIFEATTLIVLALIMSTQILFTFIQEVHPLTPWMYFFSVYQHLQYVPVILVGLFWWVCIELFDHRWAHRLSLSLVFIVSCYAMIAMSIQAVLLCAIGAIGLIWLRGANRQTLLGLCLMVAGLFFAFQLDGGVFKFISSIQRKEPSKIETMYWSDKLGTSKHAQSNKGNEPTLEAKKSTLPGLHQRFALGHLYISQLIDNPRWLVFGQPSRIERHVAPSAHNYFLDFLTNFGLFGIAPAIALILLTIYKVVKPKNSRPPFTYGSLALVGVLFFWVIFHNFLTVALRQPFPGILIFFVWGLLLSRLDDSDSTASSEVVFPQKF
jgi:hypothetical protein